jgi:hypothetical protein
MAQLHELVNLLQILIVEFLSCLYFEALEEENSSPRLLLVYTECEQAHDVPVFISFEYIYN